MPGKSSEVEAVQNLQSSNEKVLLKLARNEVRNDLVKEALDDWEPMPDRGLGGVARAHA
jgi:hypothetical protein